MNGEKNSQIIFSEEKKMLRGNGKSVELNEYAVRCLNLLLRFQGHVVTKEQILNECWVNKGVFVSDASVRQTITQLRKAMNQIDFHKDDIVTIPRQGYTLRMGRVILDNEPEELITITDITPPPHTYNTERIQPLIRWRPGYKTIALILFASFMLSVVIWNINRPQLFHSLDYTLVRENNGIRYYVQKGFEFPSDTLKELENLEKLGEYKSDTYPYVYLNHTEFNGYESALLCRFPMDELNSDCLSFIVYRGDHG